MKIILRDIEESEAPEALAVALELSRSDYEQCAYRMKSGAFYYVYRTKTGTICSVGQAPAQER